MEHNEKDSQDYSLYFLLAILSGIGTAWVISESILWSILGAILGVLTAAFFVNVIVKGNRH